MKNALIFFVMVTFLVGCEGTCNRIDRDGSLIGTAAGDWIVVKYNGGIITDVWKLRDVLVQSEEHSDGWLFKDQNGNMVNIGGDSKAIRIRENNKEAIFATYVEYHAEHDTIPYHVKFAHTGTLENPLRPQALPRK